MTRFLHRPMFRRGGSTGGGITSGLTRPGYKRGRVVEPGGYGGTDDFTNLMKGYPKAWKEYQEEIGEYPKGSSGADFWLNFGTNILAQPGGRPILQTLGTAAKDPLKQLQQQKAMERHGKREEAKDFLNTYIGGMSEMLGGDSAASIFKDEKMAARAREAYTAQVAHNDKWNPEWETMTAEDLKENQDYRDWENERRLIDSDISIFEEETGIDMETALGGKERIREIQDAWATKLKQSEEMMTHPDTGEQIEIGEFFTDPGNRGYLYQKVYQMMLDFVAQEKRKRRKWKGIYKTYESGGRAGYQGGELVEQEDVNIQTPRGDISMQETVEEGAEPDQLSYEELRSRLPVEITDDIVRLLVSSAAALGDFAQIQTQVDVDTFNSKYGVNLVLPSEA